MSARARKWSLWAAKITCALPLSPVVWCHYRRRCVKINRWCSVKLDQSQGCIRHLDRKWNFIPCKSASCRGHPANLVSWAVYGCRLQTRGAWTIRNLDRFITQLYQVRLTTAPRLVSTGIGQVSECCSPLLLCREDPQ